jgi:transposase
VAVVTSSSNARRGLMAEFGIIAATGPQHVEELRAMLSDPAQSAIPEPLRSALGQIVCRLDRLQVEIERRERQFMRWGRDNPACRRLVTIPGYGPIPRFRGAGSGKRHGGDRGRSAELRQRPPLCRRLGAWRPARTVLPARPAAICAGCWSMARLAARRGKRAKDDPWLQHLWAAKRRRWSPAPPVQARGQAWPTRPAPGADRGWRASAGRCKGVDHRWRRSPRRSFFVPATHFAQPSRRQRVAR